MVAPTNLVRQATCLRRHRDCLAEQVPIRLAANWVPLGPSNNSGIWLVYPHCRQVPTNAADIQCTKIRSPLVHLVPVRTPKTLQLSATAEIRLGFQPTKPVAIQQPIHSSRAPGSNRPYRSRLTAVLARIANQRRETTGQQRKVGGGRASHRCLQGDTRELPLFAGQP